MASPKKSANPLHEHGMRLFAEDNADAILIDMGTDAGTEIAIALYKTLYMREETRDAAEALRRVLTNREMFHSIDKLEIEMAAYERETGLPYICKFGLTLDDLSVFDDFDVSAFRGGKK